VWLIAKMLEITINGRFARVHGGIVRKSKKKLIKDNRRQQREDRRQKKLDRKRKNAKEKTKVQES